MDASRGPSAPHGVLFLCVHNAARSQMAEGWARKLFPTKVSVWSAGSEPSASVHPMAVEVMREVGVDISTQQPKRVSDVPVGDVDTVITLCAEEVCPVLPGEQRRESWAFPDPAAAPGGPDAMREAFCRVRDELRGRVEALTKQS